MAGQVVPLLPKPRDAAERAFLPAALEIVETPASPTLRFTAALIVLFLTSALVWSYVGKVDIIATAPGKVIAHARTKVVQPYDTGVVRAIHVVDGDRVERGQVLIELDPTISSADKTRYSDMLIQARLDQARLKGLLAAGAADTFAGSPHHRICGPPLGPGAKRKNASRRQSSPKSITKWRRSGLKKPRSRPRSPSTTRRCLWSRGAPTFTGHF